MFKADLVKALAVAAVALAPIAAQAQIVKCVGKDGKTYVGSTLPPQCAGQSTEQMNKEGMVVRRTDAMLTPEQRAAKDAEERTAKEKAAETARLEKEDARKNKALLSTYGSESDIEVARKRMLADNENTVKQTQDKIVAIRAAGEKLKKELEFFQGKNKPPTKLLQDIRNNDIDLGAQQELLTAKNKDVDAINARYDADKRRYLELTSPAPRARK